MFTAAKNQEKWAAEASEAAEATAEAEESVMLYLPEDADAEDYRTLAEQYAELGEICRQRNLLEQSYRLFGSEETLEQLSAIWVDLDEEDTAVQELAELMLQNMELDEYRAECLHLVEEVDWFDTMMPKLQAGCRNYFQLKNGEVQLAVTVGYTDDEAQFSAIWYLDADGSDYYLNYDGRTALLLEAEESLTDGAFDLWSFDGLTGDIQHETGTLVGGALDLEEDYEIRRFEGTGKTDIYDLMNQREDVEYTELDSYGGATGQSKLSEVQTLPDITVYEPVDNSTDETGTGVQIRVCDGELQWLSEDGWVPLGTLEELAETDLFRAYAEEKAQYDEAIRKAQAEAEPEPEETQEAEETAESTEESQAATTTTRPTQNTTNTTTTTPATTSTTETTPSTQAAETTTEPAQTDDSDDDDDNDDSSSDSTADNSDNNSSDTDTGSTDTGTTDTGTIDADTIENEIEMPEQDEFDDMENDGDTEVEWTQDLM